MASTTNSTGVIVFVERIFPWIFVLIGVALLVFGVRGVSRAKASEGWPKVQGRILSSEVERSRSSSRGSGSNRSRSSTTYRAEILYEFKVEGVIYNGNRVAYGDYGSSDPQHARRIVNRYPVDHEVQVFYQPGQPEECLLEPGLKKQAWFIPGAGALFAGIGILLAIWLPRARRLKSVSNPGTAGPSPA